MDEDRVIANFAQDYNREYDFYSTVASLGEGTSLLTLLHTSILPLILKLLSELFD
jgi:hypothetical protein